MLGQHGVCEYTARQLHIKTDRCVLDDHFFDTFTARTCHGHSLPCNSSGACIEQQDAQRVYALGDWEYKYNVSTQKHLPFLDDYCIVTSGTRQRMPPSTPS